MGDLDSKIKSVNEKIKKEEQMRLAAVRVKSSTQNSMVQSQAEQNIVDASRHIDYLTKELEKLQIKQRNSLPYPVQQQQASGQYSGYHQPQQVHPHSYTYPQIPGGQQNYFGTNRSILMPPSHEDSESIPVSGRKPVLSNLDLIKSDTPITNTKVSLKLHELEFKLGVEQKLKEGSEKMIEAVTLSNPKDRKSIQEVTVKTLESQEKLSILKRSLHKYKQLYIGEVDDEDEDEDERANRINPGMRRPVTGKLDIRILQARNVPHTPLRTPGKLPETTVAIKIDGTTKGKTRVTRNDKWNEDFPFHVEKASEIEITLYDKTSEQHQVPIGLLWIKISDIAEELRKKRIEAESGPGWVTASNAQFETSSPTSVNNVPYGDTYSVPYTVAKTQQGIGTTYLPDGIEAWFEVEPAGQISLKLNFVKENARKRPAEPGLGRQGALRKRKGEIHEQNGHKFIQQIFYQVMKCAYCEELFVNEGYQCDDCKLTCHKRCYTKIVTKCISKSISDLDSSDYKQLNHRIPHRFEPITNITANWCCHCGYILPLVKKGAKRCSECNITCHAKCTHFVPDFCGMTMKRASEMIEQIQHAASVKINKSNIDSHSAYHNEHPPLPNLPLPSSPKQTQFQYPPPPPPSSSSSYPPQSPEDTYGGQSIQPQYNLPSSVNQQSQIISSPVQPLQVTPYAQPNASMQNQMRNSPSTPTPLSQSTNESIIQKTHRVGLDDFNFLAVLGKGNFGKVMLAEEKYTKHLYAIKVLKKEFIIENDEVESTRSEKRVFQAANRERHPFLLGLHSCFQTETRIYFVMEYVSGGDLMLHIQKEQFTYRRAQFYAAEVLLALEYLHKSGIIYRDLKLDNILLTLDGHIKIADYGLCKEEMWWSSTTNTFCGTPEFMAPEILLEQRYGRAVDWWAFGVLIYEMLLGQSPFRGDDEDEIFDAILEDEILYPINMSRDSVSILQKLLTREPEKRLGSGRGDAEEIKRHPFFKGVNWDDMLAKKVPPPFYPSISSPTDTSNFDEEFTREVPVLTPVHSHLNAEAQEEFKGFSYVSDWVVGG
ncbi:kinase-like domain-containing protein [Glomus cerebriforme]|uniref:protein kinase C n=1 Tax=Glomus cerebriforme TaxID=658196 RepID=A0A397SPH1_9GLOM|nr:kinase-like domain-containing protein [Glomus cerebriforme]